LTKKISSGFNTEKTWKEYEIQVLAISTLPGAVVSRRLGKIPVLLAVEAPRASRLHIFEWSANAVAWEESIIDLRDMRDCARPERNRERCKFDLRIGQTERDGVEARVFLQMKHSRVVQLYHRMANETVWTSEYIGSDLIW